MDTFYQHYALKVAIKLAWNGKRLVRSGFDKESLVRSVIAKHDFSKCFVGTLIFA